MMKTKYIVPQTECLPEIALSCMLVGSGNNIGENTYTHADSKQQTFFEEADIADYETDNTQSHYSLWDN